MNLRIPEKHRKAGVCYAVTADGIELPVVDITHPAFSLTPREADVLAVRRQNELDQARWARKPEFLRSLMFRFARSQSLLLEGLARGRGSFLSGMGTYLMKLGPGNLGGGYAKRLDRHVAGGPPVINVRHRLKNMAELLAEGLAPALQAGGKAPVLLVNIAGGPAMDSLNALILLRKRNPEWLEGRTVRVRVLDPDPEGPAFGARALAALQSPGGPLEGVDATLQQVPYDWTRAGLLKAAADAGEPGEIQAGSSEGGLFEYGTSEEILANLEALRDHTAPGFTLCASVLAGTARAMTLVAGLPLHVFPPGEFAQLAARAGWRVDRVLEGPTTDAIRLRKG
jgi:hypothetical protein